MVMVTRHNILQGQVDRLRAVEHCSPPKLPRRDPALDGAVHLGLVHLQSGRLSEFSLPHICGPPPDQDLRDTHPGETELEEVEERSGLHGLHAENLKTPSLRLLDSNTV